MAITTERKQAKKCEIETVAPYSLRALERPTISTPVTWDEVAACAAPEDLIFTVTDVPGRVAASGDLFGELL